MITEFVNKLGQSGHLFSTPFEWNSLGWFSVFHHHLNIVSLSNMPFFNSLCIFFLIRRLFLFISSDIVGFWSSFHSWRWTSHDKGEPFKGSWSDKRTFFSSSSQSSFFSSASCRSSQAELGLCCPPHRHCPHCPVNWTLPIAHWAMPSVPQLLMNCGLDASSKCFCPAINASSSLHRARGALFQMQFSLHQFSS